MTTRTAALERTRPKRGRFVYARLTWLTSLLFTMLLFAFNARAAQPAGTSPSRSWSNPKAYELARDAVEAKRRGDIALCIQKDLASLVLEDHPYVKMHIATCYAADGRFKDALVAARDALAVALRNDDEDLKQLALARVEELIVRLARLKIEVPKKSAGLRITLTPAAGAAVVLRPEQLRAPLWIDPGEYTLEAGKEEKGERFSFKEKFSVEEGEEFEIEVLPKQDHLTEEIEDCLRLAKTFKERLKCIEEPTTQPNVHAGFELSGYTDTTSVHVVTPAVNVAVTSPTGGWNVGGAYLLDMVSAASPDLVSTASSSYKEKRHVGTLGGGYKFSFGQVNVNGNVSSEPDYLSRTLGASLSREMNDKLVTPRFGYSLSWDTIGYRDTPFAQFHRTLMTHALEAGVTLVLSPTTLLVTGLSLNLERGENSKLYRFIPVFPADAIPSIPPGASVDLVNEKRLSMRPRDFVPQERTRFALGARLNHRFSSGTLRVEERLYTDNWGIKASTTDGRYLHDVNGQLRVWPHVRLHAQSGASFYQLAYTGAVDKDGSPIEVPRVRTTDRELSPMVALTLGGGARFALTADQASTQYALVASADVMFNSYSKALFITSRTALWGTVGLEAEF
jgi:hypothetical protein